MGEMSLAVTLPRLIFMEGETLMMEIRLANDSSKKVKQIDIALVMYSSFKSKTLKGVSNGIIYLLVPSRSPLDE